MANIDEAIQTVEMEIRTQIEAYNKIYESHKFRTINSSPSDYHDDIRQNLFAKYVLEQLNNCSTNHNTELDQLIQNILDIVKYKTDNTLMISKIFENYGSGRPANYARRINEPVPGSVVGALTLTNNAIKEYRETFFLKHFATGSRLKDLTTQLINENANPSSFWKKRDFDDIINTFLAENTVRPPSKTTKSARN